MISKLPRRLQIGNQSKKIKEIAQRIWTRFSEHGSSTKKDRWTDGGRMLAYIVEHPSKHKHVRAQITYLELLELVNVKPHAFLDSMYQSALKHFIQGTDWSKKVSNARLPGGVGRKGLKI
jgi:hypothetical protein